MIRAVKYTNKDTGLKIATEKKQLGIDIHKNGAKLI